VTEGRHTSAAQAVQAASEFVVVMCSIPKAPSLRERFSCVQASCMCGLALAEWIGAGGGGGLRVRDHGGTRSGELEFRQGGRRRMSAFSETTHIGDNDVL
jgi:hypothetical protein